MSVKPTIVLAAGGTGGHVYPAIAVAEELASQYGCEPLFVGGLSGVERSVVQRYGYRFVPFHAAPFERTGLGGKIVCVTALVRGFVQVRRILARERAAAVAAFGGYVSVAPVFAARSLGIPVVLHEANAEFGLANWLLASRVSKLLTSFDTVVNRVPGVPSEVVGMPVRLAIRTNHVKPAPRERVILVLSGTQPSPFFSEAVPSLVARVNAMAGPLRVVHQTAERNNARLERRYADADIPYRVVEYLDDIAAAYGEASFVISRVGASTMAEIALRGIPAMMVPDPAAAANHQARNAALFCERGGVLTAEERDWDEQLLARHVATLLCDEAARGEAVTRIANLAHPAAAGDVARTLASAARGSLH